MRVVCPRIQAISSSGEGWQAGGVVVFGNPEAVIAQIFCLLRQRQVRASASAAVSFSAMGLLSRMLIRHDMLRSRLT
jgi:hypothetical protein